MDTVSSELVLVSVIRAGTDSVRFEALGYNGHSISS
jgi:hypothetical protein